MGKYSGLKAQYAAPPVSDQKWQDKVNIERQALPYREQPEQLANGFAKLRAEKDALEEQISQLNIRLAAHEQELVGWLEGAGLTQFKTQEGHTLFIKDTPYTTVENRDEWMTYIRENGLEDMLSVHYQTMNSYVTDLMMNGKNPPPGVKAFVKSTINFRRGTNG